jgi:phospholipid-translocating ATPase
MLPRINFAGDLRRKTEKDLHLFACEGLRTLIIAMRRITNEEYQNFAKKFYSLKTSNFKDKEKKLNELFDGFEKSLRFLGCSAIEDKLQDVILLNKLLGST